MKKTVLFVLLEQYADWEAAYLGSALAMLGEGNFEVKTVSLSRDSVQSIGGLRVTPDFDVLTAPLDYAGLILIGGMTWHKDSTQQLRFWLTTAAIMAKFWERFVLHQLFWVRWAF